jgi:holliday junction DNA helicase RuvA
MIAHIKGKLASADLSEAVIDVNGVGYQAFIPLSTYDKLPKPGEETTLLTYMHVREDAIQLFGFASKQEMELFKLLITVNGIGAKTALNVLSSASVEAFCAAIACADIKVLKKLNGIGPKTAERMILELKDKVGNISPSASFAQTPSGPGSRELEDALMALERLGFQKAKIQKSVMDIAAALPDKERSSENIIRKSLQSLNK